MNVHFSTAVRAIVLRGLIVGSMLVGGAMSATLVSADSDRVSFQPVAETRGPDRGDDEPTIYQAPEPVFVQNPALPGFLQELSGEMNMLVSTR